MFSHCFSDIKGIEAMKTPYNPLKNGDPARRTGFEQTRMDVAASHNKGGQFGIVRDQRSWRLLGLK
jgi:hypothetical protein